MGKEVQAILNLLSEGVIVEGDIQTPRDIRIDGTLVGTVHTDGFGSRAFFSCYGKSQFSEY